MPVGTLGKIKGTSIAKSGQTVMGRVYGQNGVLVTQSSFTSITYTVIEVDESNVYSVSDSMLAGNVGLPVNSVVFDTLQTTDPRWQKDSIGYNFATTLPAALFQKRGIKHRIEVLFTPVSGEPFCQVWETVPQ